MKPPAQQVHSKGLVGGQGANIPGKFACFVILEPENSTNESKSHLLLFKTISPPVPAILVISGFRHTKAVEVVRMIRMQLFHFPTSN